MFVSEDDVVKEFETKSRWLELGLYFDFTELFLSEFLELIFGRCRSHTEVCPFEDIQSFEYRYWLVQKKRQSFQSDGSRSDESTKSKVDYSGYRMWRYNPIVFFKEGKKNAHRLILKDDEDMLAFLESRKFAIMSPVTYVGRSCNYANARYLYAFAVDLDGVDCSDMQNLVWQMYSGQCPAANIIVNSGHGVHVYFLLEKPVEMYEANIKLLNRLKAGLTKRVWNVSRLDDPQYQSVVQGFRLPGTLTKFGKPIRAFWNKDAKYHTLDDLNRYSGAEHELTADELAQLSGNTPYNPSRVTLKEAKEKWPEWFASRVIGRRRVSKTWKLNRGLYDWWLKTISEKEALKVTVHHRYWCILTLAIYAVKCGIPREEVLRDALALVPLFDTKTQTEDNHFTEDDVHDAMRAYDENYNTWPIHTIETTTAIRIERNRRNVREQNVHLRRIRMLQEADYPDGNWRDGNGRKKGVSVDAEDSRCAAIVREWQMSNPANFDKSQCAVETGLSLPTVRKWWVMEDSRCAAIVKDWRKANPDNNNKSQCARETGLTRPTVTKWWNG